MKENEVSDSISLSPGETPTLKVAFDLAGQVLQSSSHERFVAVVLPKLFQALGLTTGGIVSQRNGNWQVECWVGQREPLPEVLIGEAIDRSSMCSSESLADPWCVVPLIRSEETAGTTATGWKKSNSLPGPAGLVLKWTGDQPPASSAPLLQSLAQMLVGSLDRLIHHEKQERRIEQLGAVLAAALQWQRLDDDESLLMKIADAATELLGCERASIFLWDRRRKKLVGRPALGTEGNSLEVDDDAGVVGEVLATGESRIWDSNSDDESRINRSVDQVLEFQTHSLVAVPMSGQRGSLIGVFEAINALGGKFNEEDAMVLSDLATHAAVAIEQLRTRKRLTEDRDRLVDDAASSSPLVGQHLSMESVRKSAQKVAATDLTVLVLGKNGTGKEVLARNIHYESERRNGPFVAVNCAALVETLLESELFGHEKGAFTDANQARGGKFELANGGTLFLDEVGDMSLGGQAKLLRVLEEKVVVRVGGSRTIPVDVRVIAATNQPLDELIVERRFREDLFFRLNVVSLTLPPLAQRGDDVLLLAKHFMEHFCYQIGRKIPSLSDQTRAVLLNHTWPGNIRELRNTIERVCYLCSGDVVEPDDLMLRTDMEGRPSSIVNAGTSPVLADATKEFQVVHIESAIETCGGNMTDAAARLGLHRSNLYRKMRQLGMQTSGE